MRSDDPNLPFLRLIAEALGELVEEVVFVGGAVAGLLLTDPLAEGVRATRDVDAVIDAGRAQFHRFELQVAGAGFKRDMDDGVICRWVHRQSGVLFDLMPVQSEILGFSNPWYRYAVESAERVDLGQGLSIRRVSAVAFVATKLAAFGNRGGGDILGSHDLEDILNVIDGREELAAEIAAAPENVRNTIVRAFSDILRHPDFANALPGLVAEPERAEIVRQRMVKMSR
ncbi:MAG: hypothetical protein ACT4NL_06060 [Pseudomarimonas sp.]